MVPPGGKWYEFLFFGIIPSRETQAAHPRTDVLVTLSELTIHDLTKDLIEIDRKVSGQRRPLTVKVLDQYRRPHNIVIEADCNYVV